MLALDRAAGCCARDYARRLIDGDLTDALGFQLRTKELSKIWRLGETTHGQERLNVLVNHVNSTGLWRTYIALAARSTQDAINAR